MLRQPFGAGRSFRADGVASLRSGACVVLCLGLALVDAPRAATGDAGARARLPLPTLGAGSWCWFASPQAIRVGAQTITGYVDASGDIVAVALVRGAETHSYILHARLQMDDHDSPTFYERTDGRVIAFYSRHGNGSIAYRITQRPGDIRAWDPEMTVPNTAGAFGATYPSVVYIAAEHRLYVYFRGASFHPTVAYSANQGRTWSSAAETIDPGTTAGPGDGGPRPDRPYARYAARFNRTYIAFTDASPGSRPTNIYLMTRKGNGWFTVGGTALSVPATPSRALLVFDAVRRHLRSSVWDVQIDSQGHPVVALATFRNLSLDGYWYARWTGRSWHIHRLVAHIGQPMSDTNSTYAPGIAIDPAAPNVVAIARMGHPIEIWRTSDNGDTWTSAPLPDTRDGVRPVFVAGDSDAQHPELLYLKGPYHSPVAFQTRLYDSTAS